MQENPSDSLSTELGDNQQSLLFMKNRLLVCIWISRVGLNLLLRWSVHPSRQEFCCAQAPIIIKSENVMT